MGAAKLIQKWVSHKHTRSVFLFHLPLSLLKQPIMLPLQEVTTDLPAALFLFGFVNRVFQEARHQIWNRNCSLISLEAEERFVGGANRLPPPLHYAACFPVSASQVLPPKPTQPLSLSQSLSLHTFLGTPSLAYRNVTTKTGLCG